MNEPEPAPTPETTPAAATIWAVTPRGVRPGLSGGGRIAVDMSFRTARVADEITALARVIGRTAVHEKVRAGLDAKNPLIARFLKLQTEAAAVSLAERRDAAKLAAARALREEALVEAAPGFSRQVAELDAQIADLQGRAAISAADAAAIVETVATARGEALAEIAKIAADVTLREHAAFRRRRDEIVAALPAAIGATLSEIAALDRAVTMPGPLPPDLSAMLDALTATSPPESPSAASGDPLAPNLPEGPQTAADDAQTVEAAPEPVSEPGRCQHAKTDGSQCKGRALAGSVFCVLHRRAEGRSVEEASVAPAGV
jgi:hypothetical protein